MSYPAYNFTVLDDTGNIVTDVSVEVRRETPGQPLVQVYSDRYGATPLGNPFTSAAGKGRFHVDIGGAFQVRATKGSDTWTMRYVGISRGQETDITGLIPAGDWVLESPPNEYSIGEFVQYNGLAFASNINNNTSEPPGGEESNENWTWLPLSLVGGIQIDASGTFAGRDAFDDEAPGFIYASTDGDGDSITSSVLFRKLSSASADWSDPIPFQGPEGPSGTVGVSGTPTTGNFAEFTGSTEIGDSGYSGASTANVRAAAANKLISADLIEGASAYVALTNADPVAVDWDAGINFSLSATANRAIGNPTNGQPGTFRTILVQGNDATDRTITFGNQFLGDLPTITDCDSTKWYNLVIMCHTATHFSVTAYVANKP